MKQSEDRYVVKIEPIEKIREAAKQSLHVFNMAATKMRVDGEIKLRFPLRCSWCGERPPEEGLSRQLSAHIASRQHMSGAVAQTGHASFAFEAPLCTTCHEFGTVRAKLKDADLMAGLVASGLGAAVCWVMALIMHANEDPVPRGLLWSALVATALAVVCVVAVRYRRTRLRSFPCPPTPILDLLPSGRVVISDHSYAQEFFAANSSQIRTVQSDGKVYWAMVNGQRQGPFKAAELELFRGQEVLVNHGPEWVELSNHPDFGR